MAVWRTRPGGSPRPTPTPGVRRGRSQSLQQQADAVGTQRSLQPPPERSCRHRARPLIRYLRRRLVAGEKGTSAGACSWPEHHDRAGLQIDVLDPDPGHFAAAHARVPEHAHDRPVPGRATPTKHDRTSSGVACLRRLGEHRPGCASTRSVQDLLLDAQRRKARMARALSRCNIGVRPSEIHALTMPGSSSSLRSMNGRMTRAYSTAVLLACRPESMSHELGQPVAALIVHTCLRAQAGQKSEGQTRATWSLGPP